MTQSTLSIANETFPQTRADMNTALQANGSLQSGASAPGTTYAYQFWADTTNGVLKQRDSSNSSWQIRATLSVALTPAKTASFSTALGDMGKTFLISAASGAVTVSLLAAATCGAGFWMTFKRTDSVVANAITLDGNSSETLDGALTQTLAKQYDAITIETDGTNWYIVGVIAPDNNAVTNTAQTFTGAQRGNISTLTDGSTITPDFSAANAFNLVLGGSRTMANPTGTVANTAQSGSIRIRQDATGSRTLSFAWGWTFEGGTAPTLSTAGCTADDLYYETKVDQSATVTITIATPGVVTYTGHGLVSGQQIQLTTTGALPTGLTASTTYYVIYNDANSFWLATSLANAAAATKIATSVSQSGVHTLSAISIAARLAKAVA